MALSKVGSPEFQAEQRAMRSMAPRRRSKPNGWKGTQYNSDKAGDGYGAVMVGQHDSPVPTRNPWTAAVDTVTAVLHWIGSRGLTDEQVADVMRVAHSHYRAEKGGEA